MSTNKVNQKSLQQLNEFIISEVKKAWNKGYFNKELDLPTKEDGITPEYEFDDEHWIKMGREPSITMGVDNHDSTYVRLYIEMLTEDGDCCEDLFEVNIPNKLKGGAKNETRRYKGII